jgi:predicted RND superfamily exporter protein
VLALAAGLGAQLPDLAIDNSVEGFLREDDPILIQYNEFRDQFGRDDVSVIAVEPREVFDLDFLERLRALHEDLEAEVPHLEEVTSLINARSTRGEGDELIVEDLLEEWPRDEADLTVIKERVFANPLYLDTLISRDGRFTTVTVKPVTYSSLGTGSDALAEFDDVDLANASEAAKPEYLTDVESAALVKAVRQVMARHEGPDFRMHLAGMAVVEERMVDETQADLSRFLVISILAIVVVLSLVLRRVSGVVLPLVTVVLSVVSTLGTMALLEIPLSLTTEILPSFLLTVGVCYSVHILVIFFQRLGLGARREEAIAYALGHSGLAVLMTSLTTAGGLFSFAWAEVAPVGELGVVGPLGVLLAMVFSVVLLPALLAVVPLRGEGRPARPKQLFLGRLVVACGEHSARRPWTVVATWALVLALSAAGVARLRVANDYLTWFPEGDALRTATVLVDKELRGAVTLEAIVETGEENGLHAPELLRRIEELGRENRSIRHGDLFIGKTVSLVDVLKETHRALNENRPEFYAIPDVRPLVAQELLLFENSGSDDLEELVDSQFGKARISMKIPWVDWMLYPEFLEKMRRHVEATPPDRIQRRHGSRGFHLHRHHGAILRPCASDHYPADDLPSREPEARRAEHGSESGADSAHARRHGVARHRPGHVHTADRRNHHRPGRRRHDPLHAPIQPVLRGDWGSVPGGAGDAGDDWRGDALHHGRAHRRVPGPHRRVHDRGGRFRLSLRLRHGDRIPRRRDTGACADDPGDARPAAFGSTLGRAGLSSWNPRVGGTHRVRPIENGGTTPRCVGGPFRTHG